HRSLHSFFLLLRRATLTLPFFPYTTLFRSLTSLRSKFRLLLNWGNKFLAFSIGPATSCGKKPTKHRKLSKLLVGAILFLYTSMRSEEHTSELQSRENLVCRLLLEKKIICYM